LGSKKKLYCF